MKSKPPFDHNIALIGFMGSGKTTIANCLSSMFAMETIEMDALIAQREGMSISDIFDKYGEEYFRTLETNLLIELQAKSNTVISCGGGGIPVIEQKHALKGASAVIEKDAIAGKLAADLMADQLIILTSVPNVYRNFGTQEQEAILRLSLSEAEEMIREDQFEKGTMLPKIEAAISYLSVNKGGSALVTSINAIGPALKGKAGTLITI